MNENNNIDTHTQGDAIEIDYDKIEESLYQAILRSKSTDSVSSVDDYVEFNSQTDAQLYTVGVTAPLTTSAEQSTSFLLDIRNILLLFLFSYFIFNTYRMLKNTLMSYLGGKN